MQSNFHPRPKSRSVRRRLGQLEQLEQRRLMAGLPEATNDLYHAPADQALVLSGPGVLANDITTGGPLAAHLFNNPEHGTVALAEDGSFVYTPEAGYVGLDSFMYWASAGDAASQLAAVTLRVSTDGGGPLTQSDTYAVNEDDILGVTAPAGILDNDTAMSGGSLSAEVVDSPTNGVLVLNGDGAFTYTPSANFHGIDTFTYIAREGTAASSPTTVTIDVRARNDKPVSANDVASMLEDGVLTSTTSVLANDSDVDGDALAARLVNAPRHGAVVLNADGTFVYTPQANFHGVDGFGYVASDGTVDSQVATMTITIGSVNDLPIAANDEYTMNEDAVLTVDAGGILANDSDPDGGTLTPSLVSGPQNGTLTMNPDGSFVYTPSANFNGVDGFSYLVSDGSDQSAVATVTINVTSIDDAPIANNDEYHVDEDLSLTVDGSGILANDSDPDGGTLTPSIVSGPQNGQLMLNSDGSFTYTPSADFSGVDGFSYLVSDGTTESAVATVTINVNPMNDAPVAADDTWTIDEDATLTVDGPGVLANDSDPESDALLPTLAIGPQHGVLTMNSDGSFSYTPEANYHGSDSFTYTVSDGELLSNTATVSITVNAANDAPIANNDEYDVDEDSSLNIATPGLLANDSDADGDALTPAIISGPQNGELTLNSDGSFTYTPSANFSGVDGFSYLVSDGTAESAVATVTLNVNPTNDAPVAADDTWTIDEDATLTVDGPGVMANDSDPENDALLPTLVAGPQHGTLTMNTDGSFSYTPEANYSGGDSFTYSVSDGELTSNVATVSITVTAVNDAPVAAEDHYSVDEDAVLNVSAPGLLANDSDLEGDALTAVLATGPQHGTLSLHSDGSFNYTPDADFSGSDSFTYKSSDGSRESQEVTVSIVVNPMPDVPMTHGDWYTSGEDSLLSGNVLGNDFDPEDLPLTAELVSGPQHGELTLGSDGAFTYMPAANYFGSDSFTYAATNGTETSEPVTVAINIDPINDAPVGAANEYDVVAGGTLVVDAAAGALANDSDIESDPLTARLIREPRHGELTMSDDGSFAYTPRAGFTGDDRFFYQANDGRADSQVVEVVIHVGADTGGGGEENAAPQAGEDNFVVAQGETLTSESPGVLANDSDADGDALSAALVDPPAHGELTFNSDGSFSYTPAAGFAGEDSFTYTAGDGTDTSAPATVRITVNDLSGENAAPVSADDAFTTAVGTTLQIPAAGVLANDSDADGDAISAVLVSGPSHGTLAVAEDGSFAYTPAAGYSGTDSFTYQATDGALTGNIATVTITIATTENTRPNAINEQYAATADTPLVVAAAGVLANDSDAQGDALTAHLFSGPQHGAVTLAADGSFAYTPDAGYSGLDSFIYRAFDGQRYSALAAVTIRVQPAPPASLMDDGALGAIAAEDGWDEGAVDAFFGEDLA